MTDPKDESSSPSKRRVASRRASATPPEPASTSRPEPASATRPEPASTSLLATQSRKRAVYRQDFVATPPVFPAPSGPQKSPGEMLHVWHPAPKATSSAARAADKPTTAKEALKARHARQETPRKEGPKATAPSALDASWLTASDADAEEAARAAGDAGEALVQAWLDRGHALAIAVVSASEQVPARVRKAARRAINVLKARGVAVPDATAAPVPSAAVDSTLDCTASFIPPDGSGTSFYSFTQKLPDGRYRVADVMVRERAGVVHASLGILAGKHLRQWKARVEQSVGVPPVAVEVEWARHSVAEGRALNDGSKQLVPLGFDGCLVLAGPAPIASPPHPVADLEPGQLTKEQMAEAIQGSDRLHAEPEFASWAAERVELQDVVARIGARLSDRDVENREKVDEALLEECAEATARYFTPDACAVVADRLRASAISLRSRSGREVARRALVLAAAIRVTSAPREIPFLRSFFEKGLGMLARENDGRLPLPRRPASP